ncbi:Hypothetical predicted protein [Mytilus galloprovincialis]|uniref:Uncharacterized protein n=1 Tax=Mytilus galloprovincialis TaxID=29158 RepID=A0A8B6C1B1_MYTGA|nr:Hypothetical predicted protein [Mytilus galloprovincialis]
MELVKERQKLIKMADSSELGWKVVSEYVTNPIADDPEDEKKIITAQNRAERKQKAEKSKKIVTRKTPYTREKAENTNSSWKLAGALTVDVALLTCVDNSEMSGNWTSDEKLESSTWRELECARRVLCTYESVNIRRNVEAALVESGVSENCNIYNLAGKMTTFLVDSRK